jgi:hypothetical protein
MLNGFKFCHHCGKSISVATAAPEVAVSAPVKKPAVPEPEAENPLTGEEGSETDAETENPPPRITVGGMYIFELLCRVPILNLFLLAIIASSGRESPMREISRAKLLAMLTVIAVLIFAALIVVLLLYIEVIEPFYLGRWRY